MGEAPSPRELQEIVGSVRKLVKGKGTSFISLRTVPVTLIAAILILVKDKQL